jgi:hypothetical protein
MTTGSGGVCSTPCSRGRTCSMPDTCGVKSSSRLRIAVGKRFTPRTISMSSVRPTQRMRGPVRPVGFSAMVTTTWSRLRKRSIGMASRCRCGVHELALGAVLPGPGLAAGGIDQFHVHEAARHEVHALAVFVLGPGRQGDIADAHGLAHAAAEGLLDAPRTMGSPPPGSPAVIMLVRPRECVSMPCWWHQSIRYRP